MELTLEDLKESMRHFSSVQCEALTENCIAALEAIPHKSNCKLEISGIYNGSVKLKWTKDFKRNGYKDEIKITEKAAEALSFFLVLQHTEYEVIEESRRGTGIDYWLCYKEDSDKYDPFNFLNARLEISGILRESKSNSFSKRIKIKENQTEASDNTRIPAYVSIIEFSNLKAYIDKK